MPRTAKPLDLNKLQEVARLYHEDLMSRTSIATQLQIDERLVSTMLEEARRQHLVQIGTSLTVDEKLARRLRETFGLKRVIIVPSAPITNPDQYADVVRRWGEYAAAYFDELVNKLPNLHIAVSGGETLLEFVNAVRRRQRDNVYIYPAALVGRGLLSPSSSHVDPIVNATILWNNCGRITGRCNYATVHPYDHDVRDEEQWDPIWRSIEKELHDLERRPSIKRAIEKMTKNINVVFAGLGIINPDGNNPGHINKLTMMGLLKSMNPRIPELLSKGKALADLSYCLFDDRGATRKNWQLFLTPGHYDSHRQGLEFYRNMVFEKKDVVVIAGAYKERAIYAALNAGLFNVWITNQEAAKTVLEMKEAADRLSN